MFREKTEHVRPNRLSGVLKDAATTFIFALSLYKMLHVEREVILKHYKGQQGAEQRSP
jgi:hypothetical protein